MENPQAPERLNERGYDEPAEVLESPIDLMKLVRSIWRHRALVAGGTLASMLAAAIVAFSISPRFTATATLLPADSESVSSSLPSSLLGLAGIVGVTVDSSSTAQEAILTLRSRAFLYDFIERHGIRRHLFPTRWDEQTNDWRPRSGDVLSSALDWLSSIGAPPDARSEGGDGGPSRWEAYERFRDILDVSQDRQTSEIRVSLEWYDPALAADWVNNLVADLDAEMRRRAIAQSTGRLSFLEKKLDEEGVVTLREAISSLMEKELTRVMLASVQGDFSLRVIDPAVPPERKSRPRRLAILFVGALLGLFGAMVASQVLDRRKRPGR